MLKIIFCLKKDSFTDLNLGPVIKENGLEMPDTVMENKLGQMEHFMKEPGKTTR
jgi:hypothetical protein